MSPSRVLAVAASGWMCGDLEGGLVCDLEQVSQSILWHSRTVLGRVSLTGHWQTAWVQGSWLSWGTERLIEQLGIEEISPSHRHHDCSQSSWSIIPTLLGQVTFTNKPSSFQKLNQKRGGHREMTVETCITSSWANHRVITAQPAFLWGKRVPEGWATVRGKKGLSFLIQIPARGFSSKEQAPHYLESWTFSCLLFNLRSTYTVVCLEKQSFSIQSGVWLRNQEARSPSII